MVATVALSPKDMNAQKIINLAAGTLDTDAAQWGQVQDLISPQNGYTEVCPVVGAGGTWTVTHNLDSKHLVVQVARVAAPHDFVDVGIERPTNNTLAVKPDVAIAAGEFEIMIMRVAA